MKCCVFVFWIFCSDNFTTKICLKQTECRRFSEVDHFFLIIAIIYKGNQPVHLILVEVLMLPKTSFQFSLTFQLVLLY